MAQENHTWGEERIANQLRLKLGLRCHRARSHGIRGRCGPGRDGLTSQRWAWFVRNHARGIVACDFFATLTIGFWFLHVFVVLEVGTRRILHWNVTEHPAAARPSQRFRAVITPETCHPFVLHERDGVYSATVDHAISAMGRHVLKTPARNR